MTERMLRQAKRGNADAFIALCAPFEGMVYRHCLQMLRHQADAQDAAQETMLRAFRSFQSFEQRSELGTWLFRIAHNICLDILKRAHRRRENASLDALHETGFDPPACNPTPEDEYIAASERDVVREALRTLPERQQALLSLRYGDHMSYAQIARAMKLSLGTVKSALSRAREDLRAAVQNTKR